MPKKSKSRSRKADQKRGGSIVGATLVGLASLGLGGSTGASGYYLYKTQNGQSDPGNLAPAAVEDTPPPLPPRDNDDFQPHYGPPTYPLPTSPTVLRPFVQEIPAVVKTVQDLMQKANLSGAERDEVCAEIRESADLNTSEKKQLCNAINQCYTDREDQCQNQSEMTRKGFLGGGSRNHRNRRSSRRTRRRKSSRRKSSRRLSRNRRSRKSSRRTRRRKSSRRTRRRKSSRRTRRRKSSRRKSSRRSRRKANK